MKEDAPLFALQVFGKREYATVLTGERRALEAPFEEAAALHKPRRIVRVDKAWPLRPAYRRPAGSRGGRSAEEIVSDYCKWAAARGLQCVTVYIGDWRGPLHAQRHGLEFRKVDPSDFLGSAPPDEDESCLGCGHLDCTEAA